MDALKNPISGGFSPRVFFMTFLIIGGLLWGMGLFFWDLPLTKVHQYLTAEGNFPQSVAVVGVSGYLIYKFFDLKNEIHKSFGAIFSMIVWFLILLVLKFLDK